MFEKVLIANRGEIAVRIERALDELGVGSVAVYSELDRNAPHVARAGETYNLGEGGASENYLSVEKILDVATRSGAEAIHPGYGFLAENAPFAQACEQAGIVFIGPPASAIEAMGSKTRARELMKKAGVPIVPGTTEPVQTVEDALKIVKRGDRVPGRGQGRGRRRRQGLQGRALRGGARGRVRGRKPRGGEVLLRPDRLPGALPARPPPRRGAGAGRPPRERDPPGRARLLDPAPPPEADRGVTGARVDRLGRAARANRRDRRGGRDGQWTTSGAGTIEGLLSSHEGETAEYFFLEMNTRVQVEHCVTEMTTGVDIVKEGIRAAAGEELSYRQQDVVLRGHAIECRINAEDASKNFAPAPGRIGAYSEPAGPGVRVDSGVQAGSEVSPMYDPMVAKLIVWDADREQATRRMLRALGEFEIEGLRTLIPFHEALLATEQWARGETCRDLHRGQEVAEDARLSAAGEPPLRAQTRALARRRSSRPTRSRSPASASMCGSSAPRWPVPVDRLPPKRSVRDEHGRGFSRRRAGVPSAGPRPGPRRRAVAVQTRCPRRLQGNMWKVLVKQGDTVEEGQLLCIIEAMKMENEITAHKAGTIVELPIVEGAAIQAGAPIATIKSP